MNKNDERFLMKVVDMYYNDEYSQEKIAKKLDVSRATVSRTLSQAKKEGYVRIMIDFPKENTIELEKMLEKKYNAKEVVVAQSNDEQSSEYLVAKKAALYLARVIKKDMLIGVTWGCTMKKIVDAFDLDEIGKTIKTKGVEIVPMLGTTMPVMADGDDLRLSYSSLLSNKLAQSLHGISYNMPAPMYVRNLATKEILLQEPQIADVLEKARHCKIGVFGIGTLSARSSIAALDKEKQSMVLEMKKQGGVGELIGRIFDKDGNAMSSEIEKRLIGLSLNEIQKIPTRVGVAFGEKKSEAIHVAMKSSIINVLITDYKTAKILIKK